jgi:hypothetical protein
MKSKQLVGLLTSLLWSVLFAGAQTAVEYWVSPSAPNNGTGANEQNPAPFNPQTLNSEKLGANGPTHFRLRFLPGDYFVSHTLWIDEGAGGPGTRTVEFIGPAAGNPPARLILNAYPAPAPGQHWDSGTAHHWLIRTAASANGYLHYLNHVVVANLTLDGNFDGQGAYTSPAKVNGYKSFAAEVNSKSGLLDTLLVTRFGSVGAVPGNYFNAAGTEAFPVTVRTFDDAKSAYPSWLIQNVEVTEFRSLHGGYSTLIMPIVRSVCTDPGGNCLLSSPTDPNAPPIISVRRCQVRGTSETIAFGTAAVGQTINNVRTEYSSRRISFEDNVVLNSTDGLNTDTGAVGWITVRRNAFLDISNGANLGRSQEGINTQAAHHNYRIENNLFRLRGQRNYRDYNDFDLPVSGGAATDPNLALGRIFSPPAANAASAAMILQGRATQITFANNWLTTWPEGDFLFPSVGTAPASAQYRVVWAYEPNVRINLRKGNEPRSPAGNVSFNGCKLSGTPFEFAANSAALANEVSAVERLAATSAYLDTVPPYASDFHGSHYSAGYQDPRTPATAALSFQPKGRVEAGGDGL